MHMHCALREFLPIIVMSSDLQHSLRLSSLFIANCYLRVSSCLCVLKRIGPALQPKIYKDAATLA